MQQKESSFMSHEYVLRSGVSKFFRPRDALPIKQQVGAENTIEVQMKRGKTVMLLLINYVMPFYAVTI